MPAIIEDFLRIKNTVEVGRGMDTPIPDWLGTLAKKLSLPSSRLDLGTLYWRNDAGAALTAEPYDLATESWRQDEREMASFTALQRHMYYEFHEGRQPWILREFDRASMAHGIEVRSPFLDWRLVRYAFSLPPEVKLKNGYAKYVLRRAMAGIVPDDIRLRRKKVGFPLVIFDLVAGPLRPLVNEVLNGSLLDRCSGIDATEARPLVRDHLERGHMRVPWLLANAALLEEAFRGKAAEVRQSL